MKWIMLMIFTFISGQAFSKVKFEKIHQLSFQTGIKETLIIMKPMPKMRLASLHNEFRMLQDRSIAAKR